MGNFTKAHTFDTVYSYTFLHTKYVALNVNNIIIFFIHIARQTNHCKVNNDLNWALLSEPNQINNNAFILLSLAASTIWCFALKHVVNSYKPCSERVWLKDVVRFHRPSVPTKLTLHGLVCNVKIFLVFISMEES